MPKISPESLARASSRHPWRTVGLWVVMIVAMGAASSQLLAGVLNQDIAFTNKPESVQAQNVLDAKFPNENADSDTEFFIVSSRRQTAQDPAFQKQVQAVKAGIGTLPADVRSGPVHTYVDAQAQAEQLFTPDGHGVLIPLQLTNGPGGTIAKLQQSLPQAAPAGFEVAVATPAQLPKVEAQAAAASGSQGAGPALSPGNASNRGQANATAPSAFVLVTSSSTPATDPAFANAVKSVEKTTIATAGEALAQPPVSGLDLQAQAKSLVSADLKTALIPVTLNTPDDTTVVQMRAIASKASTDGYTVQVAGNATLNADFTKIAEEDLRKGEGIGLAFAFIVLLVVFAAILAAFVPIVMAIFAIGVALGLVALIGQLVHFNLFVENIVSMIGLAVGIDYSLFIVSRFREERRKGFDKLDAIGAAGATANRAVFFSGITVVLALAGMFLIPTTIFRAIAGGAMIVTIVSIAASMTLLPAILALLGDKINWPHLGRARVKGVEADPRGGFWDKVTLGVMKRPVVFLAVSVLVLGGLGSFYFQLHRGTSQSVSTLPSGFESKAAFLTLQREFNAGGVTDPAQIVVTGDVQSSQVQAAIAKLRSEIANDPAFSKATTVATSNDGSTVLISAYFRGDPESDPAFQAIRDLRSRLVPAAFGGVSGATALVGGNTAFFTDFLDVANQYQWIVLAFVLGLSFILLTVVFRSIVVPIKAIIMNLLSVGAAYGAVTLVFQKGVGLSIFNDILQFQFTKTHSIEAWLPLFLFSILFGLSMDYHVFLLTRIREEYDKTGDNTEAVAYGLRTTAGIITGAALIMVVVFAAFAAGRLGPLQQMGFGLAVAVFMDATIVRTLLVPASMRLLGDLNWYLPSWLQWLPQVHVEGHEPTMRVPEAVPVPLEASDR